LLALDMPRLSRAFALRRQKDDRDEVIVSSVPQAATHDRPLSLRLMLELAFSDVR
jgi:hypothetical protein